MRKRWRALIVVALLLLPLIVFLGAGMWTLWDSGRLFWLWWFLPLCWGAASLLGHLWRKELALAAMPDLDIPMHWTPRDESALEVVRTREKTAGEIDAEKFTDPRFYLETALSVGRDIARHYQPGSNDPIESLTVPEILAAGQLAFEDLELWVRNYVPGSHLLTVKHWRWLSKTPSLYRTASNVGWAASMVFNPLMSLGRYAVARATIAPVSRRLQSNILATFYVFFLRQVATYAIEMHSGRLRGGAARYRAAMKQINRNQGWVDAADTEGKVVPPEIQVVEPQVPAAGGLPASGKNALPAVTGLQLDAAPLPAEKEMELAEPALTVTILGRESSGKSSLINALLGRQVAETAMLPDAPGIRYYRLPLPGSGEKMTLLDTPAFGIEGWSSEEKESLENAVRRSDLILLLLDAREMRREPELELLRGWAEHFDNHPHFKPPPIIAVLTHVDLLEPVDEWAAPDRWRRGTRGKEAAIRTAVTAAESALKPLVQEVVPVCLDPRRKLWGVFETLLPTMNQSLDQARASATVRSLHEELDRERSGHTFRQLKNAGSALFRLLKQKKDEWRGTK